MAILRPIMGKTELLQAIGLVSVFHSTLQFELAEVLKVLLQVPARDARFLVSQMPFRNTLRTIKGLASARMVDSALASELENLLGRAQKADEERNRLLHSDWGVPLGLLFSPEAVRLKPKPEDFDHHQVHSPQSITAVAEEIRGVVDAFAYFWPRLRDGMPPSTSCVDPAAIPPPVT